MTEKSNDEWFVKTVENTANTAIAAGRHVNEVIHDTIEVIYGRKNINELLPSGWIVVTHDCSDCEHDQAPHTSEPCFRCYNRFFGDINEGPYTDNFKSKDEQKITDNDLLRDCENCGYDSLRVDDDVSPCYSWKEKDPEDQKHVAVNNGRYCHDCKYEELKIEEQPCYNCYWKAARPSFTPKEEE